MSTTFRLNNSTLSNCIFFFFLEEYTKISTPRQEVLFKKGSIGAKKKLSTTTSAPPVGSSVHADSEQDSLNGNAASPVSPSQGDSADPFQYSGKSQSFSFSNEGQKQKWTHFVRWVPFIFRLSSLAPPNQQNPPLFFFFFLPQLTTRICPPYMNDPNVL